MGCNFSADKAQPEARCRHRARAATQLRGKRTNKQDEIMVLKYADIEGASKPPAFASWRRRARLTVLAPLRRTLLARRQIHSGQTTLICLKLL